jgi:cytidyltransferase-like protein
MACAPTHDPGSCTWLVPIPITPFEQSRSQDKIRVYVDMVADLFHFGHVNFLRQASEFGDHLIVGIHADETVMTYKRRPIMTMDERMKSVAGCRYVDEVLSDAPLSIPRSWIEEHKIDLILHGDDFSPELVDLCYAVPREMGIFKTVKYSEGISTTEIIRRIKASDED